MAALVVLELKSKILQILRENDSVQLKDLIKRCSPFKKGEINRELYAFAKEGRVEKVSETPPIWRIKEADGAMSGGRRMTRRSRAYSNDSQSHPGSSYLDCKDITMSPRVEHTTAEIEDLLIPYLKAQTKPLKVAVIARDLKISQVKNVTAALFSLRKCNIVTSQRDGKAIAWSINQNMLEDPSSDSSMPKLEMNADQLPLVQLFHNPTITEEEEMEETEDNQPRTTPEVMDDEPPSTAEERDTNRDVDELDPAKEDLGSGSKDQPSSASTSEIDDPAIIYSILKVKDEPSGSGEVSQDSDSEEMPPIELSGPVNFDALDDAIKNVMRANDGDHSSDTCDSQVAPQSNVFYPRMQPDSDDNTDDLTSSGSPYREKILGSLGSTPTGRLAVFEIVRRVGAKTKKDINPELYAMERQGFLKKVQSSPPIWELTNKGHEAAANCRPLPAMQHTRPKQRYVNHTDASGLPLFPADLIRQNTSWSQGSADWDVQAHGDPKYSASRPSAPDLRHLRISPPGGLQSFCVGPALLGVGRGQLVNLDNQSPSSPILWPLPGKGTEPGSYPWPRSPKPPENPKQLILFQNEGGSDCDVTASRGAGYPHQILGREEPTFAKPDRPYSARGSFTSSLQSVEKRLYSADPHTQNHGKNVGDEMATSPAETKSVLPQPGSYPRPSFRPTTLGAASSGGPPPSPMELINSNTIFATKSFPSPMTGPHKINAPSFGPLQVSPVTTPVSTSSTNPLMASIMRAQNPEAPPSLFTPLSEILKTAKSSGAPSLLESGSLPPVDLSAISSDSFAALNKNPISALMEYAQSRKMTASTEVLGQTGPPHNPKFRIAARVGSRLFPEVIARNKKDGRREAADLALRTLISEGQYQAAQASNKTSMAEKIQKLGLRITFFDKIAAMSHHAFNTLAAMVPESMSGRKVLAAMVMKRSDDDEGQVISVGTGNRCIEGIYLSLEGKTVNDSHAEVITRRGLIRFLYNNLLNHPPGSADSVFQAGQSGRGKMVLKPGISFHLYISTAPCGDGALFSPTDVDNGPMSVDEDACHDPIFTSTIQGVLRTKMERGEGTIPIEPGFTSQTWDGILRGERLRTMSCSDKICRWNLLGMQGALLSYFLEPVYLGSLTLGYLYVHGHLSRAVCCRLDHNDPDIRDSIPPGFHINHPKLGRVTAYDPPRETEKTTSVSLNWVMGDRRPEVTDGTKGCMEGKTQENRLSQVSKLKMYALFKQLCQKFGRSELLNVASYNEAKLGAKDFQEAKQVLYYKFRKSYKSTWVSKPPEEEMFS